jgi:hypothetical protein
MSITRFLHPVWMVDESPDIIAIIDDNAIALPRTHP